MKKRWQKGLCIGMAAVLGGMQAAEFDTLTALAKTIEYEGVTQFSSSEVYSELDTSAVKLIVEEVYIAAGDYLKEGENVLKLTADSYQDALDYYTAAVLRSQNSLTNVQMDYDKAVQEVQYTYEFALAEAKQAEFVREQQIKELEDTITEHEDVLAELEEAIAEYEAGIAAGSYASSSSSSSSGGGSGAASASSKSNQKKQENESAEEEQSEMKLPAMSGITDQSEYDGQSESSEQSESEDQSENGEQSESEDQSENGEQSENMDQSEAQTDEWTQKIAAAEEKIKAQQQALTNLEKEKEEKDKAYNELLKELYQVADLDVTDFCGVWLSTEAEAVLSANTVAKTTSAGELPQETIPVQTEVQTQAETAAQTEVQTQAETVAQTEVQTQAETVTQTQAETVAQTEVQTQAETAPQTEAQTQAETVSQTEVQTQAETAPQTKTMSQTETENDTTSSETNETEVRPEKLDKLETILEAMAALEKDRSGLYKRLEQSEIELNSAQSELEQLKKEQAEENQQPESGMTGEDDQQPESGMTGEDDQQSESGMTDEGNQQPESGMTGEDDQQPESGMTGDENQQSESGVTGENSSTAGGAQMSSGAFPSMSGSSSAAGSGASASSGMSSAGIAASAAGNTASGGGIQLGMNGQMQSGDSDISLFGDEYDLTEVKNLLEQEPSDEDQAEELLEKLQQWQETVAEQYAELLREEEVTRLEIQYTYDTAVIAGKQAEITYQEDMETQEETLQTAKDELAELEEEKALLETFTDGVLTAQQEGYVAAVNYEAEDRLQSTIALYSIYEMDTATVALEVPQEEIDLFSVGDSVDVQISGIREQQGTVSAKAADSTGEGSRTDINYEVEVSIDNTSGRLSTQSAAVITIEGESEEESGNE